MLGCNFLVFPFRNFYILFICTWSSPSSHCYWFIYVLFLILKVDLMKFWEGKKMKVVTQSVSLYQSQILWCCCAQNYWTRNPICLVETLSYIQEYNTRIKGYCIFGSWGENRRWHSKSVWYITKQQEILGLLQHELNFTEFLLAKSPILEDSINKRFLKREENTQ